MPVIGASLIAILLTLNRESPLELLTDEFFCWSLSSVHLSSKSFCILLNGSKDLDNSIFLFFPQVDICSKYQVAHANSYIYVPIWHYSSMLGLRPCLRILEAEVPVHHKMGRTITLCTFRQIRDVYGRCLGREQGKALDGSGVKGSIFLRKLRCFIFIFGVISQPYMNN